MSNKALLLPSNRLFNNSNIATPGGTASLYLSGTTTPANFLAADGVTSLGSTITANGIGQLPDAYGDDTVAYRLILKDALGATLNGGDIDPFHFGIDNAVITAASGASVSARSTLAELPSPVANQSATLTESGREGTFVFSTANLSAQVTADTQQGLYVAPASDTTGASGAWVRQFTGRKDVRWFGAKLDGVTDDGVALQAWLDSGGALYVPEGDCFSSATLILRRHVDLEGSGYGFDARTVNGTATVGYELQPGARIHFPAGVPGFDIQPQTTVTDVATAAAAGAAGYTQEGAMHSSIRNLALVGAGTGALATGLHSRTTVYLENVHVLKFQGKGFDISASSDFSDGNSEYGLADLSTLTSCKAIYNGSHGFHLRGRDVNGCTLTNCWSQLNGGWGYLDESIDGNTNIGGQAATNTLGSYKCILPVANSEYIGCYAEDGTGQAPDLSYRCNVIGGKLADAAVQSNVGTNGKPNSLSADGLHSLKLTFDIAQVVIGAIAGKAVIQREADRGAVIQGAPDAGGNFDVSIVNKNGTAVMQVPTGTATTVHLGPVWAQFAAFFINGDSVFPGIVATQAAMFTTALNGLTLAGFGSTYDTALANKNGTVALGVPTGTTDAEFKGNITAVPAATATPASNGQMTFELTSNTTLKIKVKGSDGVVRSTSLTLA